MGFFDPLTSDELTVPQKLLFTPNESVDFLILPDFIETTDGDARCMFNLRVLVGEHEGKIHKFNVKRSNKVLFLGFLGAFYTDAELKAGVEASDLVGKSFKCTPRKIEEYQGYQFQRYDTFSELSEGATETPPDDIPF